MLSLYVFSSSNLLDGWRMKKIGRSYLNFYDETWTKAEVMVYLKSVDVNGHYWNEMYIKLHSNWSPSHLSINLLCMIILSIQSCGIQESLQVNASIHPCFNCIKEFQNQSWTKQWTNSIIKWIQNSKSLVSIPIAICHKYMM